MIRTTKFTWLWRILPAASLAALTIVLFCLRARHTLWILPFTDETQHILGGRVLHASGILYRDFVDSHGPLAFLLAETSDRLIGIDQPGAARIIVLLAMFLATVSVVASPCLRGAWERLSALALFLGLSTSLWIVQALFMLTYQPLAGMLLVIGAAQFTFCAWCGAVPCRVGLFAAGAAFALVPFTAYAYAPSAVLLAASGMVGFARRGAAPAWLPLASGAIVALAGMGGWILLHCDLTGYLVYHFVLNEFDYARYISFSLADIVIALVPSCAPDHIAQSVAAAACLLGWLALALPRGAIVGRTWRPIMLLCGLLGMVLSNPRGSSLFQDGAFVLLAFAGAALGWARLPRMSGVLATAWLRAGIVALFALAILGAERTARAALTSPHGYTRGELQALPAIHLVQSDAEWARRLRHAVAPDEHFLALPFAPDLYTEAGRLPMPGFYYYFPWDTDYARHPWFGREHDICAALRRAPPPVIFDNDWVVWGQFAPKDYMPCVGALLASSYWRVSQNDFFYVRHDRVAAWQAPP
jgi:hypothetical protein